MATASERSKIPVLGQRLLTDRFFPEVKEHKNRWTVMTKQLLNLSLVCRWE
jgi:hypothetical protein